MRSPTIVTWQVRRTRLPVVRRPCPACGSDTYESSGKFRINANGKLLDVWLLLQCTRCDRTTKATVIERSASIDLDLLRRFEDNDPDLIAEVLFNPATAQKNRFTLEWEGCWEITCDPDVPFSHYPCSVSVTFADPVSVRPVHLIARGLGVSRSKIKHMVDARLIVLPANLGFETCAAFEFTIMAEAQGAGAE
jgi:hypothetical protein